MTGPAFSTTLEIEDASTHARAHRSTTARQAMRRASSEEGGEFVGQEPVTLSTPRSMLDGHLEPRPLHCASMRRAAKADHCLGASPA